MATNKASPWRAVRSLFGSRIACRSFVTENLNKIEDVNKGVCISGGAKDSEVRVWWDVQRCGVPVDRDVGTVMGNIRDALRGIHCFGPVEFWGYGDMTIVPFLTQSRLHNAGVRLRHVPFGSRAELQDQVMIADIIAWTKYHPPPAVHMVTLKKPNYPYEFNRLNRALDLLRVRGYDAFLVVHPDHVPDPDYPLAVAWRPWETLLADQKSKFLFGQI